MSNLRHLIKFLREFKKISRTNLRQLTKGQWLQSTDGVFEVVEEYDSFHSRVTVAEVSFSDDGSEYELGEESYISDGDASHYQVL